MKLAADLDAYLEHLRSERQLSAHTLSAYRRDLDKLRAFAQDEQLADWQALDSARLRRLIAHLHQQGLSSRSLARLLSACRGLYQYLGREGLCRHDPAAGLSAPRGNGACLVPWMPTVPSNSLRQLRMTTFSPGATRPFSNCSTPAACA